MVEPDKIKDKALKRLWEHGDVSGIKPEWRKKVIRILSALNAAVSPQELELPGLHDLKGNRAGTHSAIVSANWRLTFKWDDNGPYDIDMEDYHGK